MKKLYLLAAAALCAATATAANGDVTDGWLMLEDFENNPEVPGLYSLYSNPTGEVTIENIATDDNAENKAAHFTGGDYNSGLEVKVSLPAGKTLADYDALDFDIYDFGMSYKAIFVRIGDNKIKEPEGSDVTNQKNKWKHFYYEIDAAQEGSEILVRVGFKISASDGGVGFGIDNIRLREKAVVAPGTYDESKNGTVTDGWLMIEDFQNKVPGHPAVLWGRYGNAAGAGTIIVDPANEKNVAAKYEGGDNTFFDINVTLPEGKTLANYKAVSFDLYRFEGDKDNVQVHIYVNKTNMYHDSGYPNQGKVGEWTHKTITIPEDFSLDAELTSLQIGLSTGNGIYAIDNICFQEKAEPVEPGTYDESKNGTVTDGWLMVEDFQNKQPGDDVTVKTYWGGEGKGSAKIEVDSENAKNLTGVFSVTDGDYNTIFALNITLPDGKTLKNYEKVAFDLYRFSDDDNYKQMLVMAGEEQIYLDLKDNGDADYVQQAPDKTWTSKEYTIDAATTVDNTFTLYFGIKTNKGHYAVDNVRLLERTAAELELVGEPVITIKHGTAAGTMTVSYSFEVKNHNGEEIKVVATVDGHDEVIFEEAAAEPENAPARAADENKTFSGNLKAQHDVLKSISNPNVSLTATAGEKQLFAITKAPDTTTGIEDVTVDSEAPVEYFNLQGLRVAQPEAGQLYIKRQGDKAVKVRF